MNDNGYIRKIDELGRIVIPKELRQRLKIQDGENLIINCIDKKINLSKYSYIGNNIEFVQKTGDQINFIMNYDVVILDLENIIYSNNRINNNKYSSELLDYINNREGAVLSSLVINDELVLTGNVCIEPIISGSLGIGLVIFNSNIKNDYTSKICKLTSEIISFHIDIT